MEYNNLPTNLQHRQEKESKTQQGRSRIAPSSSSALLRVAAVRSLFQLILTLE
jgi:hypothetical protein